MAIYIEVPEKEIIDRLSIRAILLNRTDDTPEVIQQRFANYDKQTKPLIEYYHSQNKLVQINGMQSVEDVFADICKILDAYNLFDLCSLN